MAFVKSMILWSKTQTPKENKVVADETSVQASDGSPPPLVVKRGNNQPTKTVDVEYGHLALDCVISESHSFSNEVTSYPISNGFIISDHTIKKNKMFSLNGLITDVGMVESDLLSLTTVGKVAGAMVSRALGPVLGSLLGSAAHAFDPKNASKSATKEAFETLQELVTNGTIVHVATILGTYEGCVLREVRINQDNKTSSVLPVVLTFEQLRIIQPDGRIGFNLPEKQKEAMRQNTPTDTETMLRVLKGSGVGIVAGYVL